MDRTTQKRAQELLHHPGVAKAAADKAVLNREWVLTRLMENAEVALGKKTIKVRVARKDKDRGQVEESTLEVSAHDAAAANRALELLGRAAETKMRFRPLRLLRRPQRKPRSHLAELATRYRLGGNVKTGQRVS